MSELVNYARLLARKGYIPTPLQHDSKQPMNKGWPTKGVTKTILDDWESNPRYKDAALGIVTRFTPALDFDINDIDICQQMVSFTAELMGVDNLLLRTGNAPKTLAVFQTDTPFPKMKSKKYEDFMGETQQIEILGDGQQFAAFGVHEKTGKPYHWNGELPLRKKLPVLTPELASKVIAEFERLADFEGWDLVTQGTDGVPGATKTNSFWTPTNLTDEQREAVLDACPNDGDYDEWVADTSAIHYEYGGSNAGLEQAIKYSLKSSNCSGPESTEAKWDTFSLNRPGVRTFASLIKKAKEHGYDVNSQEEKAEPGKKLVSTMARFNHNFGMSIVEGTASVVYRERDLSTGDPKVCFMPVKHFKDFYSNHHAVNKVGEEILGGVNFDKPIPEAYYWLSHAKRNSYKQVYFKPEAGRVYDPEAAMPKGSGFNLYTGLKFLPVEGDWTLIRRHLIGVWCKGDMELFTYVLGWMGNMFQHPDKQGYAALILNSEEGGGKNIIVDMMIEAFGSHGAICTKPEDITGRFNSFISTAVFLFMNEAVWGGNKQLEGPMKSLITDDYLVVERKFIERFKIKNCSHLIFASNNDFPAYIGRTDRRNVVLELDETHTNDPIYFDPLRAEIKNGGKEAFIFHLLNMDLSGFNPRELPAGAGQLKHKIKLEGGSTIEQWFAECLDLGEIRGAGSSVIEADDWAELTENQVSRKQMLESLEHFAHMKKSNARSTSINMGVFLKKSGVLVRKSRGAYIIPDIETCHKLFDKYMQKRR